MTAFRLTALLVCLMVTEVGSVEVVCRDCPRPVLNAVAQAVRVVPDSSAANAAVMLLRERGYLDAEAAAIDDTLTVTPGVQFRLLRVSISGDTASSVVVDRPFTPVNLEHAIDKLLLPYHRKGHYYAAASVAAISETKHNVSLELKLAEGPMVEIGKLEFDGLTRSDPDFLRRFVRLTEGDTLTSDNIRAAERAISSVPFLTHHGPAEVRPRAGYTTADLLFTVEEKKQFRFEGGAGYLPGDGAGMVWHLRTEILNLFGQGREASIFSERREKGRNRLAVQYRQPVFIAGTGIVALNVTTRDYRREFYEFAAGGELTSDLSPVTKVGVGVQWKSVEPSGDGLSYRRYRASFSVDRDRLDKRFNPTGGYRWHSTLSYSNRRYRGADAEDGARLVYNETHAQVALDFYGRMTRQLVAHFSINYAAVETSEALPPLSELVLVGGPGTLRGYRNEQFAVVRSAYGSVEPQLRFAAGSLFGFYDVAYLNERMARSDESITTNEFFRHGYGFGLMFQDRDRRIKLSLSWNPDIRFDEPRLSIEIASDL